MASDRASRREALRTIVASAILSAAPLSVIEAATKEGSEVVLELKDGTQLTVTKVDNRYRAIHKAGAKVIDEKPSGSFTLKAGEVVELKDGVVVKADVKPPSVLRGGDWFALFWK